MKKKGALILTAVVLVILFCAAGCDFDGDLGGGGEPTVTSKDIYIRGTILPSVGGLLQNQVYLSAYSYNIPISQYFLGETIVYNPDGVYKNGAFPLTGDYAGFDLGSYSNKGTTDGQFEIKIPKGRIGQTHTKIWFLVGSCVWNDEGLLLGPVNVSLYPNDVENLDLGVVHLPGEVVQAVVAPITVGGVVPSRLRFQLLWTHADSSKTFLSYFRFSDPEKTGKEFTLPIGGKVPDGDQIELAITPPGPAYISEWGTPVVIPLGPWSSIKGNTISVPSFDIPSP